MGMFAGFPASGISATACSRNRASATGASNRIDDAGVGALLAELRHELEVWFCRFASLERDGARQPVTGKGQLERVGPAGEGRTAFAADWHYIDEHGKPRRSAVA